MQIIQWNIKTIERTQGFVDIKKCSIDDEKTLRNAEFKIID